MLLDRTLDSASTMTHQQDTLMDRLMNTLTRLDGHSSDSQVDMSKVCHVHKWVYYLCWDINYVLTKVVNILKWMTDWINESTSQMNESTQQMNESTQQTNESTEQMNELLELMNESTEQMNEST